MSTIYSCTGGESPLDNMSFLEKMKKAGKTLVDSGARTMLRVRFDVIIENENMVRRRAPAMYRGRLSF